MLSCTNLSLIQAAKSQQPVTHKPRISLDIKPYFWPSLSCGKNNWSTVILQRLNFHPPAAGKSQTANHQSRSWWGQVWERSFPEAHCALGVLQGPHSPSHFPGDQQQRATVPFLTLYHRGDISSVYLVPLLPPRLTLSAERHMGETPSPLLSLSQTKSPAPSRAILSISWDHNSKKECQRQRPILISLLCGSSWSWGTLHCFSCSTHTKRTRY